MTVGISSFAGFCSAPNAPWADVEGGVTVGVLSSFFEGG